jgi:hypothetical protein
MSYSKEEQLRFIQDEIQAWIRQDVDPALRAAIVRRQKNIPEETLSNLRHDVLTDLGSAMAEYQLAFQDSARLVDMKRLVFTKRPIQQGNNFMLEWAKKKGLKAFKKGVPGYKSGSKSKLTDDQKLERIASAMIRAKSNPNYTHKSRGRWYNRLIYKLISRLTSRLRFNQADYFAGVMREEIEKAFEQRVGVLRTRVR